MNQAQLLRAYRKMLTIRLFELRVRKLYRETEVFGAIHLYIGQEAVAVGVCEALRQDDCVTSTHRGHGHFIANGGELNVMMAELMGKETGCHRRWRRQVRHTGKTPRPAPPRNYLACLAYCGPP